MDRSPYGYSDLEWISDLFLPFGFVTIGQDMRGTKLSEGTFSIWHSDADDSQDLGDWVVQQEWSDGNVNTFGASADGLAAFTTLTNRPQWLRNMYFIWTSSLGKEVIFPNGAYLEALADMWIRSTVGGQVAEDSLRVVKENEDLNGVWWEAVEMTSEYYGEVKGRSGFWAGWYDIFLIGNIAAFTGFDTSSHPDWIGQSRIVIDPCGHCQDAAQFFKPHLIQGRTLLGLMQAFEVFGVKPLKRTGVKKVTFYVMSSNDEVGQKAGLYWTTLDAFPTPTMVKFYAHADGTATTTAPAAGEGAQSTSYVFDPAKPTPTVGGNNLAISCGPMDQTEVDKRSDILLFTTPIFRDEFPMTGPLFADIFVGSSAVDTDFMVKIEDIYPTGEARLLQDSAIRMRWREGGNTSVKMEVGGVYPAHLTLWNTSYVVAPGHRLRFAISSSNWPRFSVNFNNGHLLGECSGPQIVATNTFYHSAQYPSSISLPAVSKEDLPPYNYIQIEEAFPQVDFKKIMQDHPDLMEKLAGLHHFPGPDGKVATHSKK